MLRNIWRKCGEMTEYSKIFIDTAPLIYFLENNPQYHHKIKFFLEKRYEEKVKIMTSVITIEEYCVFPYRNNDMDLIRKLDRFMTDMEIGIINIDVAIAKKASKIRGMFRDFKAMDSLQLAAACIKGCDMFLTNDKQLRQFKEIKCVTVDELS